MKYRIVEKSTSGELEAAVQAYLQNGWQLQGGLCVSTKGACGVYYYHQAMVKPPAVPVVAELVDDDMWVGVG